VISYCLFISLFSRSLSSPLGTMRCPMQMIVFWGFAFGLIVFKSASMFESKI